MIRFFYLLILLIFGYASVGRVVTRILGIGDDGMIAFYFTKKRGRTAKCTTSFFPFIVLALSLIVNTGTFNNAKLVIYYDITKKQGIFF